MTIVFRVEDLVVRRTREAVLSRLSLELAPGTVTVLLGRNGAGKTTLLRAALGLLRPAAGRIIVCGVDPMSDPREARRRIGFVPDLPDAPGWMTARDLARFLAPHYPTWSAARFDELLARLDVPRDRAIRRLSRGEAMKAMLAAAIAPDPALLLLDEPFAGLDPVARDEVLGSVIGVLEPSSRTVLVATHDLDVAARVADRVAVLEGGRIAREEDTEHLPVDAGGVRGGLKRLLVAATPEVTA